MKRRKLEENKDSVIIKIEDEYDEQNVVRKIKKEKMEILQGEKRPRRKRQSKDDEYDEEILENEKDKMSEKKKEKEVNSIKEEKKIKNENDEANFEELDIKIEAFKKECEKLEEEKYALESKIFSLETEYLNNRLPFLVEGQSIHDFEGYLLPTRRAEKQIFFMKEERLFSNFSFSNSNDFVLDSANENWNKNG